MALGDHDRLPPVSQYAKALDVGTGTVQTALTHLRRVGAIDLEPQGRLGTAIRGRGLAQLWHVAMERPILAGMPMPYSRIFEGLSTGLRESFRREGLSLVFFHVDGSRNRLNVLLQGNTDFAVLSALGSQMALDQNLPVEVVCRLGRGSFLHKHVMVSLREFRKRRGQPTKVGIDPSSLEHGFITRVCCNHLKSRGPFEFKDVPALDFTRRLAERDIDLIVWPTDETLDLRPRDVQQEPIPTGALHELGGAHTEASLVVRADDAAALSIVSLLTSKDVVRRVQAQVIRGLRAASY